MRVTKQILVIVATALLSVLLAACTSPKKIAITRSLEKAHLQSEQREPLRIPAGLSISNKSDEYVIPAVTSAGPIPAPITPPND